MPLDVVSIAAIASGCLGRTADVVAHDDDSVVGRTMLDGDGCVVAGVPGGAVGRVALLDVMRNVEGKEWHHRFWKGRHTGWGFWVGEHRVQTPRRNLAVDRCPHPCDS